MSLAPLPIRSAQGDYLAEFPDTLEEVVAKVRAIPKAVIVVDRNIVKLYGAQLGALLKELPTLQLDATEEEKTLTTGVAKVTDWLQQNGCTKQSTVVAIGGGIIQDICCFSAHIYYRGIAWAFVPTTLLSQSDSCIGAKCGINLNAFKNQLGVFQSPVKVLICTKFIETLSDHDVASGYGEILKLMLTGSEALFVKLRDVVAKDGLRGPRLAELIYDSLVVKKGVIEKDEYEKDLRRILNYGHSFGHSLETITRHEVPHGLAVAWGLDLINFLCWKRGLLEERHFRAVHEFVRKHLPFTLSRKIGATELIDGSRRDKKVADGQINLALLAKPGALQIVKTPFDQALENQIADYLAHHDAFDSH